MTTKRKTSDAFDAEDAAITAAALSDPDNPPLTEEQIAEMRPMAEVLPEFAALLRSRPGRPKKDAPKVALSLRLDPDLIEAMRRSGPGWQARVNAELRRVYGLA
ncbi:BrnA antitoxin family protein [Elstera cyanobacteriorum]|uniref:BrnA antitoxin family protein n=1 Tax=Elstera cyanobacteriorum TaxID=2022747 RepID=UPI0023573497|nr:BrnA antitoxin family protein [Elstera cyanobacteriorum]MCK6442881.1 BrnA antitoxin family protein [Elstera cyanobacteriorum]